MTKWRLLVWLLLLGLSPLAGCNVSSQTTIAESDPTDTTRSQEVPAETADKNSVKEEVVFVEDPPPEEIEEMSDDPREEKSADVVSDPLPAVVQAAIADDGTVAVATFGAGCFWCVEAVFLELAGVHSVESGYMGGTIENPTYEQVCSGRTGHAEVCQVKYDPAVISFDDLLHVFWKTHDPTTLNRQGNDTGTQYRSAVFYHTEQQKELAEKYRSELNNSGAWSNPIVTEITPASKYYKAEKYHQNYFALNPGDGYCRAMIPPKLEKLRKVFKDKLKKKNEEPGE